MTAVIITHEVEDVSHWLTSPKRTEVFPPLGATFRTFVDPSGSNLVGLVVEVPDMAAFQAMLQSPEGGEALKFDRIRPKTIKMLIAS